MIKRIIISALLTVGVALGVTAPIASASVATPVTPAASAVNQLPISAIFPQAPSTSKQFANGIGQIRDNYGNGWALYDAYGHGNPIITATNGSTWTVIYVGGGWYQLKDAQGDCLTNNEGSGAYAESCVSAQSNHWKSLTSSNAIENQEALSLGTAPYLTAGDNNNCSTASYVFMLNGNPRCENQWYPRG